MSEQFKGRLIDDDTISSKEHTEEVNLENVKEGESDDGLETNSGDCIHYAYARDVTDPRMSSDQHHAYEPNTSSDQHHDNISLHLPPRSYVLVAMAFFFSLGNPSNEDHIDGGEIAD